MANMSAEYREELEMQKKEAKRIYNQEQAKKTNNPENTVTLATLKVAAKPSIP